MDRRVFQAKSVYIQGRDAKARHWTESFEVPVQPFATLRDMTRMLREAGREDVLIFRYQNSPPSLRAAVAVLVVLWILLLKARFLHMRVVWICHNVDQDTQPYHKWIERLRRKLLARWADLVFVLDPLFVSHCVRQDAHSISFGPKREGSTRKDTLAAIRELAGRVERVILIAGQDGGKYKAFERIPELHARFVQLGLRAGFVTAGMSAQRQFSPDIESDLLRINEPNLRESDLAEHVDYIYRENADISIPYTIYAAATAHIPVVTDDGSFLADILKREGIGLTTGMLSLDQPEVFDFDGFLQRNNWMSLHDALVEHGIQV